MSRENFEKKCKRKQGRVNVDVSEYINWGLLSKPLPGLNVNDYHSISEIDI